MTHSNSKPLAIVGIACLLPKSQNLGTYWRNIVDAKDCLSDVPDDHSWSPKDFYDADPATPDKTWATRGGFIDPQAFDPMQHGVIPVALEAIDSDQLLALLVARECLKDAGIDVDSDNWDRERVACILGHTSTSELVGDLSGRLHQPIWKKAMERCGVDQAMADEVVKDIHRHLPQWQEQSFPGMLANVVSGRIANRLDLGGTNATVDAACASSLAALQYAASELQNGNADLAITGGSDTLNDIFMYMCFTKTPALSKTGDARPFDADADGIVISEGIAMVAMKRLEDAERDGDKIYAVIRGIGTSSDGRNKSIYAPNADGQTKAVRRAYAQADFPIETIELIEAHGTGTRAGDLAEFTGLKNVFSNTTRDGNYVALGSVKSQIGHTKATAGTAGLIKAVMALHQKVLPPTAKINLPNPNMGFDETALYLNSEAKPWIRHDATPRRAGVSAFGFGGTNYHIALEEYQGQTEVCLPAVDELFVFGASDKESLLQALENTQNQTWNSLIDASRSVLEQWAPSPYVLSFTADSMDALNTAITIGRTLVQNGTSATQDGVRFGAQLTAPKVAILFPGQGSQYPNMARTLALRHPKVRQSIDRAAQALTAQGRPNLGSVIFPPSAYDATAKSAQASTLTQTQWAQPAIGAVSHGMHETLKDFGIHANAFAGHSYGELVALTAAGILSEDDLWTASRVRGESMAVNGIDRGTMAAVSAPLSDIETVLKTLDNGVVFANRNHPRQGVISGTRNGIKEAIEAFGEAGFSAREIPVSAAFHSPLVADAKRPFQDTIQGFTFAAPHTPVYSNVTAAHYTQKDAVSLLSDQITSPVNFVGIVDNMVNDGIEVFIECGPKGVLSGLLRRCLKGQPSTHIATLDGKGEKQDGDTQLKHLLAQLASIGVPLNMDPILNAFPIEVIEKPKSKATIQLAGANYKKPTTLNPERPDLSKLPRPTPSVAAMPAESPVVTPSLPPQPSKPTHSERQTIGKGTVPMNDDTLSSLLEATRQSLEAFQRTQEQTANVHAQFLQAHAKANENFSTLFNAHTDLLHAALGHGMDLTTPLPSRAQVPPTTTRFDTAPPVANTHEALANAILQPASESVSAIALPSNERIQAAPTSELPPIMRASTLSDLLKTGGELPTTPAQTVKPAARAVDVGETLRNIVADKTGYPHELIQFSMDMESDLGIDSIKRVEILSAVQEALPNLPELDAEEASSMRTLGDIRDGLTAMMGGHTETAPSAPISDTPSVDAFALVRTTIAEKTGYPVDLIEAAMDLEADLGIDSIKRVEILSAIQEALPHVGELDAEVFGALHTVQNLSDSLQALLPQSGSAQQSTNVDYTTLLTDIIAERTGYPSDLIEPTMDMESDLGIDSIKRVEILSAVQEALPNLPELDEDAFSTARTLQEMVQLLEGTTATKSATPTVPSPNVTSSDSAPIQATKESTRREVLVYPLHDGVPVDLPAQLTILAESTGLTEALLPLLPETTTSTVIEVDWEKPLEDQIPETTQGLLFTGTLAQDDAVIPHRLQAAFCLIKALPQLELFVTITDLGGTFGHENPTGSALQGALSGLTKTVHQERPHTRCLALDIHPKSYNAALVRDALVHDYGCIEVGISEELITLQSSKIELNLQSTAVSPTAPKDLIVVSGGARGVTAAVVKEMAQRWAPHFLLLGRSPWPENDPEWAQGVDESSLNTRCIAHLKATGEAFKPTDLKKHVSTVLKGREMRATCDEIQQLGATVTYTSVDVRNAAAVRTAIQAATAEHGPVRGIVHGAGVIADKLLDEKTLEQYDFVFGTKVDGFENLLAAIDPDALKLMAVFSSVAGRYGNKGQADYSMANEAITHLSRRYAHETDITVKAFHWGPWAGGMVNSALKAALEARGMEVIPLTSGAKQFCDEFERGGPCTEVVIGGPEHGTGLLEETQTTNQTLFRTLQAGSKQHTINGDLGFLDDHRIGGKPVLPFVMTLEWMVSAAQEHYSEYHVAGVRDLAVLKGIVLDDNDKTLTLEWTPTTVSGTGDGALSFRLLGDIGPMDLPTVHYKGTVELSRKPIATNRFPGSNGLGKSAYPYSVEEAYERFLFHGPGLQGIRKIVGMSDHGIVAQLNTSRPKQLGVDKTLWETDPVALDSALQLVGLWVREKRGASALPCYVEEYQQFAPFRAHVTCHIEMEPTKTAKGSFKATFVDEEGRIVANVNGGQYASRKGLNDSFNTRTPQRPAN